MSSYFTRVYPVERVSGGVATLLFVYAANGVAPHAGTTRWTYTTPTSRATRVEALHLGMMRATAPGAAALTNALIWSATGTARYIELQEITAAVGAMTRDLLGECGWLAAGDVIFATTQDFSTGGTYNYTASGHLREIVV